MSIPHDHDIEEQKVLIKKYVLPDSVMTCLFCGKPLVLKEKTDEKNRLYYECGAWLELNYTQVGACSGDSI